MLAQMDLGIERSRHMASVDDGDILEVVTDEDPLNAKILTLVNDLGNTVLAKNRAAELHGLKSKKAPGFSSPAFFLKAMTLVDRHHVRLPVLRFVMDLFDHEVLKQVVLDDGDDSDDMDATMRPGQAMGSP